MALVAPFLLIANTGSAASEWQSLPMEAVLSDLNGPVDFALAPDGAIWWNEYYSGNVTRFDPATGSRAVRFHADPIDQGVERGLVGLALDPNVTRNGVFYVYYTVADPGDPKGGTNRLSRIDNGTETILLTTTAHVLHNGGRILFVPDGSMFVATGDNHLGAPAQDPASLLGKILHLMPDGTPAPGNMRGYVYDLGHRNVYGLAYDPASGRLFATENSNEERDEVNLIEPGRNYGWPECEGNVVYDIVEDAATDLPCTNPEFTAPLGEFYWNTTVAPTGAAILHGQLYWASWNEGAIHRLTQDVGACTWTDTIVYRTGGRINDLEAAPDGQAIYYSNWTHILRIDLASVAWPAAPTPVAGPACPSAEPSHAPSGARETGAALPGSAGLAALVATSTARLLWRARHDG